MPLEWTDNHCHLPEQLTDAEAAVADARASGVTRLVDVGTDLANSLKATSHAEHFANVFATVGVHPHDASGGLDGIEDLLSVHGVVAVGECGLDYHYDHSPRAVQREVFVAQIAMAHEHDLPLVIHTREAWDDTFDILTAEGPPSNTVFHCFTGGPGEAERCLDIGAHLSFSGIVTFKTADELRAAANLCPIDRLMIETDSPFLTPVPHRGETNRPALVALVGAKIAELKALALEDVAEATNSNASRFYGI